MENVKKELSESDIQALLKQEAAKQKALQQKAELLRQQRVASEISNLLASSAKHKQEEEEEKEILAELARKRILREEESRLEQARIAEEEKKKTVERRRQAAEENARENARKAALEALRLEQQKNFMLEQKLKQELEELSKPKPSTKESKPVELSDPTSAHPLSQMLFGSKAKETIPGIDSRTEALELRRKDKAQEEYNEKIRRGTGQILNVDSHDVAAIQYTVRQLFGNEQINTDQATVLLQHNTASAVTKALRVVALEFQQKRASMGWVVSRADQLASQLLGGNIDANA